MSNIEATQRLLVLLVKQTPEIETRLLPSTEVVSTRFNSHLETNRLIMKIGSTEFLVTVEETLR